MGDAGDVSLLFARQRLREALHCALTKALCWLWLYVFDLICFLVRLSGFITMEYNDILLERKGFRMKAKFGRVWEERSLTLGFGAGTNLLLAIPLLNFMCIPLAVIGGTAMGLCLEQWELYPQLSSDPEVR